MNRNRTVVYKDERLREAFEGKRRIVIDGAMGSMLQAAGIELADSAPEYLNIESSQTIVDIHSAYVDAGAEIITTNTFGANARKLGADADIAKLVQAGIECARQANAPYVACDIGPIGELMEPMGELEFDEAYELFAEQARAGLAAGCDLFIIETMADLLEAKAAVLACKDAGDAPILATMTFAENGRTLMGTTPRIAALTLDALGVDALGINCSVGPDKLIGFIEEMREYTNAPVVAQPNAGLPRLVDGQTVYDVDVESFICSDAKILEAGASFLGSCCGTTPAYTSAIASMVKDKPLSAQEHAVHCIATSAREAVGLETLDYSSDSYCLNDTSSDQEDISDAIFDAADEGAKLLVLKIDALQQDMIGPLVQEIQSLSALPLCFESADEECLEKALRTYCGVAAVLCSDDTPSSSFAKIVDYYGGALIHR